MVILFHLRHGSRNKGSKHINKNGLLLAQEIGAKLGSFDLVITSISTRAIETCIALGYAIDDTIDFSKCNEGINKPNIELEEKTSFSVYYNEYQKKSRLFDFGNNCIDAIITKIKEYDLKQDSNVLLVSHGGVIESSTVALHPHIDFSEFGRGASHCEGVTITLNEDYEWKKGEPFRLN